MKSKVVKIETEEQFLEIFGKPEKEKTYIEKLYEMKGLDAMINPKPFFKRIKE